MAHDGTDLWYARVTPCSGSTTALPSTFPGRLRSGHGTIPVSGTAAIEIGFNATGLPTGVYEGSYTVTAMDRSSFSLTIPGQPDGQRCAAPTGTFVINDGGAHTNTLLVNLDSEVTAATCRWRIASATAGRNAASWWDMQPIATGRWRPARGERTVDAQYRDAATCSRSVAIIYDPRRRGRRRISRRSRGTSGSP